MFGLTPHNAYTGYFHTRTLWFEGPPPAPQLPEGGRFPGKRKVERPARFHASSPQAAALPQVGSSHLKWPIWGIDSAEIRPSLFTPIVIHVMEFCPRVRTQPFWGKISGAAKCMEKTYAS